MLENCITKDIVWSYAQSLSISILFVGCYSGLIYFYCSTSRCLDLLAARWRMRSCGKWSVGHSRAVSIKGSLFTHTPESVYLSREVRFPMTMADIFEVPLTVWCSLSLDLCRFFVMVQLHAEKTVAIRWTDFFNAAFTSLASTTLRTVLANFLLNSRNTRYLLSRLLWKSPLNWISLFGFLHTNSDEYPRATFIPCCNSKLNNSKWNRLWALLMSICLHNCFDWPWT